jgi:hypothetical protein
VRVLVTNRGARMGSARRRYGRRSERGQCIGVRLQLDRSLTGGRISRWFARQHCTLQRACALLMCSCGVRFHDLCLASKEEPRATSRPPGGAASRRRQSRPSGRNDDPGASPRMLGRNERCAARDRYGALLGQLPSRSRSSTIGDRYTVFPA